ncbi:MAG TPA: FUSC family membrane protein [Parapedobacter sp.]|uniref:FUSC family protein n=1 Tax=Parapedobacter sp. TaxID=1958893 RepID=UPI002D1ABEC5|nr:FUSC family membrane protein [Parapedobacter sp.]HWK57087.1 FUSC family membrane protein [Parapedobacter sp.]
MSKAKDIRNFFYSQYFSDGLRLTFGTIVPALVFSAFGSLQTGIIVSLGAMAVGLSDSPGPVHHRRNGMFFSTLSVLVAALCINLVSDIPLLLVTTIMGLSFLFSMFAVYGARASSVGTMGILIMVLSMGAVDDPSLNIFTYLLYILAGCTWYMILSLSLYQVRPYRQAQQELAESILNVADYIRIKANFYAIEVDIEKNYRALIDQQITVSTHQDNVRDQLFRGKRTIKDTTEIGRLLILIFTDIIDLFEQSMATHYDYDSIREQFGSTGVLQQFHVTIRRIGNELEHLSYQINANKKPKALYNFKTDLDRIRTAIDRVEKTHQLNALPLRKVLINIRNLVQRMDSLYGYFDLKAKNSLRSEETDLSKFIEHKEIDFKKLRENLTIKSTLFRHSLRMAIVMGIGYLVSLTFNVGTHSYWILLTIMVILKPGFSLTKERNFQRLIGTVIGGVAGALLLLAVKDETSLFILLLLFMVATFSLIRINYVVSVIFMTPYVLILFSFLGMNTLSILQERIIDTLIGSGLAFLSSYVILPSWESVQVYGTMRKLLIANYQYIVQALKIIAGQSPTVTEYKLARKEVYVTTANMASAFQRMMTEPKSKRKDAKDVNRFVVFNHILSSYSVTLLNNVQGASETSLTGEQIKVIRKTLSLLARSIQLFEDDAEEEDEVFTEVEVETPSGIDDNNIDSEELRLITDQLQFLNRIAADLYKVCNDLKKQPPGREVADL